MKVSYINFLPGSGSAWKYSGSRIRIRIKMYADPKHWIEIAEKKKKLNIKNT